MIIIQGRKLIIPKVETVVGWQGDNLVETRVFELNKNYNSIDLSLFDFKLDIQVGATKNIIDLEKEVSENKIILIWTVLEAHTTNDGLAQIQVRGFNGTAEKWHSNIEYITIKKSIIASDAFPDPLPSEFTELEVLITEAKNIAVEKAAEAFESAEAAKQSEINVGEAEETSLLSIGTAKDEALSAVENKGNEQVDRVHSVLEDLIVVGTVQPSFGLWLEEVE